MIERYTRPEMKKIWDPETRFKNWLEIEILTLEALAEQGRIPQDVVKRVRKNAKFDINRIEEIEKVTRHDVVAFTTNVGESLGEDARYIHFGLTSSDVLDSCLAMQLKASADLLLADLDALQAALKKKSSRT